MSSSTNHYRTLYFCCVLKNIPKINNPLAQKPLFKLSDITDMAKHLGTFCLSRCYKNVNNNDADLRITPTPI